MKRTKVLLKESAAIISLLKRHAELLSPYDIEVLRHVAQNGGYYNAHAHIDRGDTLDDGNLHHINTTPLDASILSLPVKQNLVGDLHKGIAYVREDMLERITRVIKRQIVYGTTRLDTNIDATPDLPEDGLLAINVALELKKKFKSQIDIRIAPTPIFGFKEGTDRWEVFKAAARKCDYLSLLPEKDDYDETSPTKKDGRIGFKRHIKMGLELACELGKEVQFHLDQANIPTERGTERLLEVLEVLDTPVVKGAGDEPTVWVIHMISPSAYGEERFARLVDKLLQYRVGVIICPSAAISMRQIRSIDAPIHNCIARVPELIKRKVPLRLGTDNICDAFVPQCDGNMLTEIKKGADDVRMATPYIWAKLACGVPLNNVDIDTVGRILYQDRKACLDFNSAWRPGIE